MFEPRKKPRWLQYSVLALGAACALWVATYIVHSAQLAADKQAAEKQLGELARLTAPHTAAAAQSMMQPVQDATLQALNDMNRSFQLKEAQRREKLALEREARTPRVYRWKDQAGTWHLSQTPPANAESVEVIAVELR